MKYRMLKKGEVMPIGTEFRSYFTGQWVPSMFAGYDVKVDPHDVGRYRAPIPETIIWPVVEFYRGRIKK